MRWQDEVWEIHSRVVKHIVAGSPEDSRFLSLALCGEAGEVANKIKKRWRGDEIPLSAISEELADVRVYLELLARCLGLDLDEEVEKILAKKIRVRWPSPG